MMRASWSGLIAGIALAALVSPVVGDVFSMGTELTSLEFVTVGNPGNAGEQSRLGVGDTTYYGGVAYTFNMGKFEATAGQYTEFLNAVADTDTFGLYNTAKTPHPRATDARSRGIKFPISYWRWLDESVG